MGLREARASEASASVRELDELVAEVGVDGWCRPAERDLLYHLARYGPGEGAIVELGSWHGLSTIYLAAGSKAAGRELVTAIDRFPFSTTTALHRNLVLTGVHDWVVPIAADSAEAALVWDGPPIRLLFIDGDHSYEGVRRDYLAWRAHVAPGGVVAFHDALEPTWPDVSRFLDEVLPDSDWASSVIAGLAPPSSPAGGDPVTTSIVVAQRRGPGIAPLVIPGAQGVFTTIRQLLACMRERQYGGASVEAQQAGGAAVIPAATAATYDHTATLEAQFHAAEEFALELEERLEEVTRAYEEVAARARALDRALRRANPIKRRARQLLGFALRASAPDAS